MDTAYARKSLDNRLARLRDVKDAFARPQRGWIRAVRTALGMSGPQFARRLKVTPARISALEKGEAAGTLTLASLEKAADALGCDLVYALVPRQSLAGMVASRAHAKAEKVIARVNDTMALEAQNVGGADLAEDREELAAEILRTGLRRLWDET